MNSTAIPNDLKKELNELKDVLNSLVQDTCKSFDSFENESDDIIDEERQINRLTFSFIHLALYYQQLLYLNTSLMSKEISKTDKKVEITRCIANIQSLDNIITESIVDVFCNNYNDYDSHDEY